MIPMNIRLISCDSNTTVVEAIINKTPRQLQFSTSYLSLQYDPLETVVKQFFSVYEQDSKSEATYEDILNRFANPIILNAEDTAKILDRERIDNTGAVVDIVLQVLQEHKLI